MGIEILSTVQPAGARPASRRNTALGPKPVHSSRELERCVAPALAATDMADMSWINKYVSDDKREGVVESCRCVVFVHEDKVALLPEGRL